MERTLNKLSQLANKLDEQGMNKLSDSVDQTSKDILNIKTAQYVGVQGYWIRNMRCWQNCYRQKRAKNQDKPAQQIWMECHDEYLQSMHDDESGWEKYAGLSKEQKNLTKLASDNAVSKSSIDNIINKEDNWFKQRYEHYSKEGYSIQDALKLASSEGVSRRQVMLMDYTDQLVQLAETLHNKNQSDIAKLAEEASAEIVKESQWRNPLQRLWDNTGGRLMSGDENNAAIKQLQELSNYGAQLISQYRNAVINRDQDMYQQYQENMANFQQQAQQSYQKLVSMSQQNPALQDITQTFAQFMGAPQGQRSNYLQNFVNQANEFLANYSRTQNEPAEETGNFDQEQEQEQQPQEASQQQTQMEAGQEDQVNYQAEVQEIAQKLQGLMKAKIGKDKKEALQQLMNLAGFQQEASTQQQQQIEQPVSTPAAQASNNNKIKTSKQDKTVVLFSNKNKTNKKD